MHNLEQPALNPKNSVWQISKLGRADVDQVAGLEKACFSLPWNAQNYLQALEQPVFELYGIKHEAQLLSYISYYHFGEELEIINIATAPACRRQGYACKLLNFILVQARKQNKQRLILEVRESNVAALALYKGAGFYKIGRRKKYYFDNNEDALVLEFKFADNSYEDFKAQSRP